MDRRQTTRSKRDSSSESSSDEDGMDRLWCFLPEEGIDIEALAFYVREFVDSGAQIRPGSHPTDPRRRGFLINVKSSLSVEMIRDIKLDSKDWKAERRVSGQRYTNSEAARRRQRRGATSIPQPLSSSKSDPATQSQRHAANPASQPRPDPKPDPTPKSKPLPRPQPKPRPAPAPSCPDWCTPVIGPETTLEDVTCPCGEGYYNRHTEAFIPGSLVRNGEAPNRSEYEANPRSRTAPSYGDTAIGIPDPTRALTQSSTIPASTRREAGRDGDSDSYAGRRRNETPQIQSNYSYASNPSQFAASNFRENPRTLAPTSTSSSNRHGASGTGEESRRPETTSGRHDRDRKGKTHR